MTTPTDSLYADGFVAIRGAVAADVVWQCVRLIENELRARGVDPLDPATWTKPVVRFVCPEGPAFAATINRVSRLLDTAAMRRLNAAVDVAHQEPAAVARQDRELLQPRGITVLTPSAAHDTNEFVANAKTARRFDLTTVSSLAPVAGRLVFGGPPECAQRPLCLPGLNRVYGIIFDDFEALDVGGPQTIAALKADDVQIGLLFSTDPSVSENGLKVMYGD